MSKTIQNKLRKYPFLTRYAQKGLINFNALARLLRGQEKRTADSASLAALSMELRRHIAQDSKSSIIPFDFSAYSLQLITRNNLQEIILQKNPDNRKECLEIVFKIAQTKYFASLIEGEKEIMIMTDLPFQELNQIEKLKEIPHQKTSGLSFISVNFPLEMREIPGIYSLITSSLSEAQISIHSFHTIGGEILILVKNEDLLPTQEVLQSLLTS